MAMSGGSDDGTPMMDMNMTPFIDVLLVLLIVFIMSIPVATHAINIDLPAPSPPIDVPLPDPIVNKIVITPVGEILWNGNAVNLGELRFQLQQTLEFAVEPELQFEPEANAEYEQTANVLNIIKSSGVTKFGFVGNERYRAFGK
ncbi:biopolymer transporter ExbD [Altererythrobacter sp. KTW20L]|uniref:ExbD/TolR family protein n=1 Tax=Altererythrobacter sp. KTW20L TaxID=2942210 RepID=UPI0020BDA420|nr:biopolymer transporter ExbD [Altererythrobacter sp. KTW20L]MCL6249847.1 biopolymer transporter ExbD [Altererythrobacter sp. KTW20L]